MGAAGRTGREVVQQALARGHEVVAFVRQSEAFEGGDQLRIVTGDAEQAEAVVRAAAGCDAVISALGHTSAKESHAQTRATQALINALPPQTRFISLTGYGVADPHDPTTPLTGRLMNWLVRRLPGAVFEDGAEHARLLRESHLDWTLIRASRLATGPSRGDYELGYFRLAAQDSIPRADVARAMVDCLTDDTWSAQAPMVRIR